MLRCIHLLRSNRDALVPSAPASVAASSSAGAVEPPAEGKGKGKGKGKNKGKPATANGDVSTGAEEDQPKVKTAKQEATKVPAFCI